MGSPEWRSEAHADFASLLDDYHSAGEQISRAPEEIKYVSRDLMEETRYLASDLQADVSQMKEYVGHLFRGAKDEITSNQPAQDQR